MVNVLVEETSLQNIANSIREKTGTTDTYKPGDMASAISNIEAGGGKYKPRYISFNNYNESELDYEIENLDTSNVTSMANMFEDCKKLTNLDLSSFNTSKVTTMRNMFNACAELTNLDLSSFDTSNVTSMSAMFYNCSKLTNLDLSSFDTSNVYEMQSMVSNCSKLTNLDLSSFNTSKVYAMGYMFNACTELTNLDLSSFDMSKVTSMSSMFYNCKELTNLVFGSNFGKGFITKTNNFYILNFTGCDNLSHDSLMSIINNLYDLNLTYNVANGGTLYTQSLVLDTTNIAKLTEDEIAIATSKGWTIS